MSKKVLMVLTSHDEMGDTGEHTGYTVPEAARPWQVFRDAGIDVDFASVRGGEPPHEDMDEDDPVQREFLQNQQERLRSTPSASEVVPDDYDAIFFVGGHGTMWDFPDSKALADAAVDVYERGGIVSSVCHGPAALVNARLSDGSYLVNGKRVNSFTNSEEAAMQRDDVVPFLLQSRLEERGARWEGGEDFGEYAVADGRLVTGQNPASATKTAELVVAALRLDAPPRRSLDAAGRARIGADSGRLRAAGIGAAPAWTPHHVGVDPLPHRPDREDATWRGPSIAIIRLGRAPAPFSGDGEPGSGRGRRPLNSGRPRREATGGGAREPGP